MLPVEVVPGVWAAGTRYVNYYVVDDGAGLTLVDAGFPKYGDDLPAVLRHLGKEISDVKAVVLTHGHVDHIGMSAKAAAAGAAVYLHPADVALAEDPRRNTTDSATWPYLRWPATWAFLAHCIRAGALSHRGMPSTYELGDGMQLDVPGKPRVIHAPGHTAGSVVLEFPEHDVVFVGDLLCTISPATGQTADPQLQTRGSNADSATAMSSLDRIQHLTPRTLLPGHGGPWRDGVEAAIASARRIGCR